MFPLGVALCSLLVIHCLAACTPHVVRERPQPVVDAPVAYPAASAADAADRGTPWWAAFGASDLDRLIRLALAQNLTAAEAAARVRQARAVAEQAGAVRWPAADLAIDGGATLRDGPAVQGAAVVSWEVDLFGRLSAIERAAVQEAEAAAEDLQAVRLALTADVAEAWLLAREQRLQLRLLDHQLELARTLLELTELRFAQGAASAVNVLQQRAQLAEVAALVPPARAELRIAENQLDVLLGAAADGEARTDAAELPELSGAAATGVPSDLLLHRPDLRRLRRLLLATDELIGAAIADRLPRLTLTGSAGYAVGGDGSGPVAGLLGGLLQPLLDWGARRAAVDEQRAAYEALLAAFTHTWLTAVAEVDALLFQEDRMREQRALLEERVAALRDNVEEARFQYVHGLSDYLPVLTAVESLQETERALLTLRREMLRVRVSLHRALGGAVPPGGGEG